MAKGKTVQLQLEIETEEEWENLIMKDGLILVDVYTDWCGPCSGMAGNLRKIKLEQGGDTLILAMAKSDNIQCLHRFRNKSRPTWMFISNCRMIRLLFGSNAPILTNIILEELQKTKVAMESNVPRTGIDFDQLTPEEQEIADKIQAEKDEKERIEQEARERAINERRDAVVENLLEPMKEFNFVIAGSHLRTDGIQQIISTMKDLGFSTVGKPNKYQLTADDIYEMFYYGTWSLTELELAELYAEETTGLLFTFPGAEGDDIIDSVLDKVYGPRKCPPGDENCLAVKLAKEKPVPKPPPPEEEPGEVEEERKFSLFDPLKLPSMSHVSRPSEAKKSTQLEQEPEPEETFWVPGAIAPENQHCKILAMRIFFPGVTSKFDLPEIEPIPPHLVIAFDTQKLNEIVELAEQWPNETMSMGFFSSTVADKAKLYCKTGRQYHKLIPKPLDAKLIVKVSKKKSEPLLSYSSLGPVYVSPNCLIGEQEAAILFPEDYNDDIEEEDEEEDSEPEPETHEDSEDMGEGEDEGQGEYEDEGEEEDMGDDDDMDLFGDFAGGMGMGMEPPPVPMDEEQAAAPPAPTDEEQPVVDEPEGVPDE